MPSTPSPIQPVLDFGPVLDTLCPDWTPIKLTGLVVQWLRQHFVPGNIQQPPVQSFTWTPNTDTGLLIEAWTRWKPQLTEKRPGLIIKRNKIQVVMDGIGNRIMGSSGADATRDLYSTRLIGSHTIFCITGEAGEAEVLAAETYRELGRFAPRVQLTLDMIRTVISEVGDVAKLEEATENFAVPITLAYAFWDSWEITQPGAPLFKQLDLTIQQQ